jgi:hypothetical protein
MNSRTPLPTSVDGGVSLYFKANVEYRLKTWIDFLVGKINPGDIFAINAIIVQYIFSTAVCADKNSHVVKFDTKVLNGLIEKDPKLNCILMRKIASVAMERLAYA